MRPANARPVAAVRALAWCPVVAVVLASALAHVNDPGPGAVIVSDAAANAAWTSTFHTHLVVPASTPALEGAWQ